ncbi:aluminum-activated malate transporter 12-like [Rhodamnia argentea]|uniref:Aluminum-activated malate transporter 12-like n=1 Tax=Rhodamnia argentea TaxID=178133 RepID=A0A8B8R2V4_9MYRT|nr:aluminum-activated malate transporter 12-like [Rhodamnia argentea]
MSSSVVVPIQDGGEGATPKTAVKKGSLENSLSVAVSSLRGMKGDHDVRRVVHSVKVGVALVLVSLFYLLDPLYERVGENAMWAIMTVVVIFEFFAGATLSKGLNRGLGTILGGGLGCIAAVLAQEIGGVGNAIVIGTAVFIFGAAATYARSVPSIKKKYDYGAMIFILTFNLVVVSGLRAGEVMGIARQRLLTIVMGFVICIFTNLLVLPNWASDDLHISTASKFEHLACSIEGLLDKYFEAVADKENEADRSFKICKSVLHSKAKDETLANFAKWEPWHGKFGLCYPWDKYLQIGEVLRELAATIVSLEVCIRSPRQPTANLRQLIKEPCETAAASLTWTLRELGESLLKMRRCQPEALLLPQLKSARHELRHLVSPSELGHVCNLGEDLAVSTFVFLLAEIVEKLEGLAKEVKELGELAEFKTNDL